MFITGISTGSLCMGTKPNLLRLAITCGRTLGNASEALPIRKYIEPGWITITEEGWMG